MRSLHKVWDGVIRWIRDYLRECAKAEIRPDYDMIRKQAYRLVRMKYQERDYEL